MYNVTYSPHCAPMYPQQPHPHHQQHHVSQDLCYVEERPGCAPHTALVPLRPAGHASRHAHKAAWKSLALVAGTAGLAGLASKLLAPWTHRLASGGCAAVAPLLKRGKKSAAKPSKAAAAAAYRDDEESDSDDSCAAAQDECEALWDEDPAPASSPRECVTDAMPYAPSEESVINWCGDGKCDGRCEAAREAECIEDAPVEAASPSACAEKEKDKEQEEQQQEPLPLSRRSRRRSRKSKRGKSKSRHRAPCEAEGKEEQGEDDRKSDEEQHEAEEPRRADSSPVCVSIEEQNQQEEQEEKEDEDEGMQDTRGTESCEMCGSAAFSPASSECSDCGTVRGPVMVRCAFRSKDGVRIAYRHIVPGRCEDDTPLVLVLHEHLQSSECFEPVLHELSRAGYLAAAMDLRGFGDSDKPAAEHQHTLRRHAEDVRRLLQKLAPAGDKRRRVALWGHGLGALVALQYLKQHADDADFRGAASVDCLVLQGAALRFSRTACARWIEKLGEPDGVRTLAEEVARADLCDAVLQQDAEGQQDYVFHLRRQTAAPLKAAALCALYRHLASPEAQELKAFARELRLPVCAIWGALDLAAPDCLAATHAFSGAPFVERHCLEDAGHDLHLTYYRALCRRALEFLARSGCQ